MPFVVGLCFKHFLVYLKHLSLQKHIDMDVHFCVLEQLWFLLMFLLPILLCIFFRTDQILSPNNNFTFRLDQSTKHTHTNLHTYSKTYQTIEEKITSCTKRPIDRLTRNLFKTSCYRYHYRCRYCSRLHCRYSSRLRCHS